ncbi:hypothetical protein [uncultured Draconibacterium sp.]|uniref:hypothetical protein n=1 Tax=uncultured Draconibacterium sp. TaxID=1573823 RepID=UPI002635110E|nr:hypothetical protein [uncultured Draconibacterium sp.]
MKQITIILSLLFAGYFSFSQEKTEYGISTEGSWFMPHREPEYRGLETKNGFGTGIGVYASRYIFWRVSADIGIAYRYKQMQQHYSVYTGTNDPNGYAINAEGWNKLPMHYVVVPIHLKVLLSKNFFVKGGIESTWLLNYEIVNEKPEFNWIVGFGSQKYKLKWSVNYIRGFKEQGFLHKNIEPEGYYKGSINRNNMLQLQLSYPLGQLKF